MSQIPITHQDYTTSTYTTNVKKSYVPKTTSVVVEENSESQQEYLPKTTTTKTFTSYAPKTTKVVVEGSSESDQNSVPKVTTTTFKSETRYAPKTTVVVEEGNADHQAEVENLLAQYGIKGQINDGTTTTTKFRTETKNFTTTKTVQ